MSHPVDLLSAYLDGELPAGERSQVEAHLRGCAVCATRLEDMRTIDEAARRSPLNAPEGYFDSLPGRIRRTLDGARARPRPPVWAWAAAAALILAVLTPLTLRERQAMKAGAASPAPATAAAEPETPSPAAGPAGFEAVRQTAPEPSQRASARTRSAEKRRISSASASEPPKALERKEAVPAFAAEAPSAPPALPAATPAPAEVRKAEVHDEAEPARRLLATSAAAKEADSYVRLLSRWPASAREARELREAWRAFTLDHPTGVRADEARVRAIEAGLQAYRRGGEARDLALVREDAEAYLLRPDALQTARVRALLEGLDP